MLNKITIDYFSKRGISSQEEFSGKVNPFLMSNINLIKAK